jgi:SAM-dependent methyltransferase
MAFLGKWGKVTGVDFSVEALQFAKFFSFKELVRVDVLKLPFSEASFHLVTALDMIEHVQDDNAAIREAHRILKPGAYFLITVPAFMWLWGRHDVVVHHQRRYRRRALCQQLRRAGFTIIESSYFMTLGVVDRLAQNLKDVLVPPSVDTRRVERHIKSFSPAVDSFLLWVIRIEKYLLRLIRLPFGTSILIMARKPLTSLYVSR